MANFQQGGALLIGADYNQSGTWNFVNAPTIGALTSTGAPGTASIITNSAPTIASPTVTGTAGGGMIFCKQALFTENATSLTHTATVTIPAGSILLDILVVPQVLWVPTTSAVFTCGDANSANGWFTSTSLVATDLLLGERLQASNANNWGGVNGSYLTTSGRFGQQSTTMIGGYCPTAYSVIGVVTVVAPNSTTGRTRMYVLWMSGESVAPVLA